MKVAIDVSPLKSAHKFRGVGFYTKRLIQALRLIKVPDFSVRLIEQGEIPKDADLIHYPYFDLFFLSLPIRKPKPTVVTIHDVIPLIFPEHYPKGIRGWLKLQIQKFSLKRVSAVITDSKNSKGDIVRYLDFPKERIFVVPLAPGDEFKPITIKQKYNLPERFVLYVGDINWNKNIPGLVQACEKVKIPLVIVGKQAKSRDYDKTHPENQDLVWLQSAISNRAAGKAFGDARQQSAIIPTGFVPTKDLVAIYNLASVYCQPSFYEGFCLPVLEAMACGTPVVCSKVSSLPEVVDDVAIFVDPNDYNSIAEGIKKVIENKKLSETLRKRGLLQARKFSWQKTARETIRVYAKVIEK